MASTRTKVEEMMVVGRWLVNECHGAQPAIARLAKRLSRLDSGAFQTLLPVLNDMGQRSGDSATSSARYWLKLRGS